MATTYSSFFLFVILLISFLPSSEVYADTCTTWPVPGVDLETCSYTSGGSGYIEVHNRCNVASIIRWTVHFNNGRTDTISNFDLDANSSRGGGSCFSCGEGNGGVSDVEISTDCNSAPATSDTQSRSQSQQQSSSSGTELDFDLSPAYEETKLTAGFSPDPYTIKMSSGGDVDAEYLGSGCIGFVAQAPDARLHWSGESSELRFFFRANDNADDTTLVINLPVGSWKCNDDANGGTRNPMVLFNNPPAGQFDIWVGSYSDGEFVEGVLSITELDEEP